MISSIANSLLGKNSVNTVVFNRFGSMHSAKG